MRARLSIRSTLSSLFAATTVALAGSGLPIHAQPSAAAGDAYAHIFYIMMENQAAENVYGNTADAPYINSLVASYGSATNFYGVTHPSLPNYLAAISGSYQGIWDDCAAGASSTCAPEEFVSGSPYNGTLLTPDQIARATSRPHMFGGRTIIDQLEAHGLAWKAYMESMPAVGFTGEYYPVDTVNGKQVPRKLYAQKHDPFMYFSNIRNNPARMQKIVPFTQFAQDLSGQVPNFLFIVPNQCHDMHGLSSDNAKAEGMPNCASPNSGVPHGPIAIGDAFLKATVGEIMQSAAWKQKSAIVIAWDENDYSGFVGCCHSPQGLNGITLGGGRAPFLVITSDQARHVSLTAPLNHYSFLATLEQLWGLGCLNQACNLPNTSMMTQFFQ